MRGNQGSSQMPMPAAVVPATSGAASAMRGTLGSPVWGAIVGWVPRGRDRNSRDQFRAYWTQLPVEQRGALIVVLWVNAVATLARDAAWLSLTAWILHRAWHGRGRNWTATLSLARSPVLAGTAGATAVHWMAPAIAVRALDARVRAAVGTTTSSRSDNEGASAGRAGA